MDSRQLCLFIHSALADLKLLDFSELDKIEGLLNKEPPQALLQRLVMKLISVVQQKSEQGEEESVEITVIRLKEKLHRHVIQETLLKMQVMKLQFNIKQMEEKAEKQAEEITNNKREIRQLQHDLSIYKVKVL
mmetsp:Transcript_26055/g.46237  ORF Transcript_26055/g.46237 Transcript_26055/m.46237 type:complete len:133 (-) Transcript_26055:662-1060(-)